MFEGIQRSLSEALKKLRGRGRITEANIREAMQEVRKALLEADVNFTVAQDFIAKLRSAPSVRKCCGRSTRANRSSKSSTTNSFSYGAG